MQEELRCQYLETLGFSEYLYNIEKPKVNVLTDKQANKDYLCIIVEKVGQHNSFINNKLSEDLLTKMLDSINLDTSKVKYLQLNNNDLTKLKNYNSKAILFMGDFNVSGTSNFSTYHPSDLIKNSKLKRHAWEVLKKLKSYLL